MSNYVGLYLGYGVAIALAWAVLSWRPALISGPDTPVVPRKWLELSLYLLAVAGVIVMGQLWVRGVRLPETNILNRSANQLMIFAPILLLIAFRPYPLLRSFLPPSKAISGLIAGIGLGVLAVSVLLVTRYGTEAILPGLADVYSPGHAHHFVQVFLEDLAIAALLTRVLAVAGTRITVVLVATLFAAAHIPAFLSLGIAPEALWSLVLDTGLGILVLGAIIHSRSIWWFFPLHAGMDMTQFMTSA